MTLSIEPAGASFNLQPNPSHKPDAGLAPLLLTIVELIRQLLEAQVIRRMDAGELSEAQLDRAAESLQTLQEQVLAICKIFDVDPAQLNLDLGEIGSLLPKSGGYYPGQTSSQPTVLELLDRLLHSGIVLQGSV
ncbi:MAG: gas vesicle protein K, partial [Synechococcales bacterium]|nr:gas vesicle protein K [Synechococcales bacterium]